MKTLPKVYTYENKIYPRVLYIADSVEGLDKLFTFTYVNNTQKENKQGYDTLVEDRNNDSFVLCTSSVIEKKTKLYGVLISIADINDIPADGIAHESVHVADYICQEMGIYTQDFSEGNEAYAYLVGWAAGCISDAIIKIKQTINND